MYPLLTLRISLLPKRRLLHLSLAEVTTRNAHNQRRTFVGVSWDRLGRHIRSTSPARYRLEAFLARPRWSPVIPLGMSNSSRMDVLNLCQRHLRQWDGSKAHSTVSQRTMMLMPSTRFSPEGWGACLGPSKPLDIEASF